MIMIKGSLTPYALRCGGVWRRLARCPFSPQHTAICRKTPQKFVHTGRVALRCGATAEIKRIEQVCRASLLSGRRWPRRVLPPGESRWVFRCDRPTDWRTTDRYITLSARRVQRKYLWVFTPGALRCGDATELHATHQVESDISLLDNKWQTQMLWPRTIGTLDTIKTQLVKETK